MILVRTLSLAALLATVVSSPLRSEEQPQTAPTRDVDITYQITRPGQPVILERRRWFASQHLRRVDDEETPRPSLIKAGGNSRSSMQQITRTSRWRGQLPSGCPRKMPRL